MMSVTETRMYGCYVLAPPWGIDGTLPYTMGVKPLSNKERGPFKIIR